MKNKLVGGFSVPHPTWQPPEPPQHAFVFETAHTARDVREISRLLQKLVDTERYLKNTREENDRLRKPNPDVTRDWSRQVYELRNELSMLACSLKELVARADKLADRGPAGEKTP
jgi:hypothetical protein